MSWTAPTDPLLVLDVNGDGRINNGTELVAFTDPSTGSGQAAGGPLNLFSLDNPAKGGNGDDVFVGGGVDNDFIVKMMTERNAANTIFRSAT